MRQRRERTRERERATAAAVRRYLAAWQSITTCETERDGEIAELRRRITIVEDEAAARIEMLRADQAAAARTIREQPGHTDDDVADLLEITPKQARQLLTQARAEPLQVISAHSSTSTTASDPEDVFEDPGGLLQTDKCSSSAASRED
ncbi:hypothetical protein [Nocardia farcinica]|uniref:hypothetical protein n=1 Tax=Nocardia farcinica TaxID=37329 RepID=UPI002455B0E5|nr:hypothetical protein [Nocardia farcinica]